MADATIRIDDLQVRRGRVRAVDGLSLDVPAGSLYGLLGPNGAGKTTTISCLAGLLPPASGRVRVAGLDPTREPRRVHDLLGVVPQEIALYPELSVADNLHVFAGLHGLRGARRRDRVAWGLDVARLEERASARVETLSGGMKRCLNLACSLLHEPRIVVCDEPTAGVDARSRRHLFGTIRALHAAGRTVVYTTHHMDEVEALCERVAILDRGRLVADDTLDRVLRSVGPSRRHTVSLAAGADPRVLETALRDAGLPVESVRGAPRSLEDVFLELTGDGPRDGG
ncbi:MAG: ABC transporter ATP-binding protein [Myxococcota bacterium]